MPSCLQHVWTSPVRFKHTAPLLQQRRPPQEWRQPTEQSSTCPAKRQNRGLPQVACSSKGTEEAKLPSNTGLKAPPKGENGRSLPSLRSPAALEEAKPRWELLNLSEFGRAWQVPWGLREVLVGLPLWGILFYAEGAYFLPWFLRAAGPGLSVGLPVNDKASVILVNQVFETGLTLGLIAVLRSRYPSLPEDVLKLDLRKPFTAPNGWLAWGLLAILSAPPAVFVAATLADYGGYTALQEGTGGTVDAVAQLLTLDNSTFAQLFVTTAVLAPLLEEYVFRGFLLASLTKVMPTALAVVTSAAVFGASHVTSLRDVPQLVGLGIVLGFSYVRSRNLMTPILLHGTWNGSVITLLFLLSRSGVDLSELLAR